VVGSHGPGEPGVGGGGVAAAGVLPAGHRDHASGRQRAAVVVEGDGGAVVAAGCPGAAGGS
jgi:hypothetical protein